MLINAKRKAGTASGETPNLDPRVESSVEGDVMTCRLAGNWTTRRVAEVDKAMRAIPGHNGYHTLVVDISEVGRMDTAGAWLIERLLSSARAKGLETRIEGQNQISEILLGAVGDAAGKKGDDRAEGRTNFVILILA